MWLNFAWKRLKRVLLVMVVMVVLVIVLSFCLSGSTVDAAALTEPTGALTVTVVSEDAFMVQASGWYTGSSDWGTCLYWGHDEAHLCFSGFDGLFTETHVMQGYEIYTVTLIVSGTKDTYETWEVVDLSRPVITPTCQINVGVTDLPSRAISASVAYTDGVEGGWHGLWFGDEPFCTLATSLCDGEPTVGWQGTDGIAGPWSHQYATDGDWPVTARISGTHGYGVCTATVAIHQPEPVTPTCTIAHELDLPSRQVTMTVEWENGWADSWHLGRFGDETLPGHWPVGWQGVSGTVSFPHVYAEDGDYTLAALIHSEGEDGVCTDMVAIHQPETVVYLPWIGLDWRSGKECTLKTHCQGWMCNTSLDWWGAPNEWHMLYWGDGQSVGFLGSNGSQSWTHVYDPGTHNQRVVFSDGTIGCEATVTVPSQQVR